MFNGPNTITLPVPTGDTWTPFSYDQAVPDNWAASTNTSLGAFFCTSAGAIVSTFPTTDYIYFNNFVVTQTGAIVDLDLSIGVGSVIPDRSMTIVAPISSNRYPGTLNGSWIHTLPRASGSADGTYDGTRKVVKSITAWDNQQINVAHGLGTTAVQVFAWHATTHQAIQVSMIRRLGLESSEITLQFGLFGQTTNPGSPNVQVVIVG
jgi:hypothetical protein